MSRPVVTPRSSGGYSGGAAATVAAEVPAADRGHPAAVEDILLVEAGPSTRAVVTISTTL